MNLARQIAADYPDSAEFVLGRVANSIAKFRDAWNKTKYFGKEAGYGRVDIPSTDDVVRPGGVRQGSDRVLTPDLLCSFDGAVFFPMECHEI